MFVLSFFSRFVCVCVLVFCVRRWNKSFVDAERHATEKVDDSSARVEKLWWFYDAWWVTNKHHHHHQHQQQQQLHLRYYSLLVRNMCVFVFCDYARLFAGGTIKLEAGSTLFLKRSDVESLVRQGVVEHIASWQICGRKIKKCVCSYIQMCRISIFYYYYYLVCFSFPMQPLFNASHASIRRAACNNCR